jgi:hypothetical protein
MDVAKMLDLGQLVATGVADDDLVTPAFESGHDGRAGWAGAADDEDAHRLLACAHGVELPAKRLLRAPALTSSLRWATAFAALLQRAPRARRVSAASRETSTLDVARELGLAQLAMNRPMLLDMAG